MKRKNHSKEVKQVLVHISSGISVRQSCGLVGIAVSTFLDNVDSEQYARAREACADAQFDEMADLEMRCLSGALDAQAFRAAMDARKWRLARMRPTVYGDKIQASAEIGGKLEVVWGMPDGAGGEA